MPATIDDPLILDEVGQAISELGYPLKTASYTTDRPGRPGYSYRYICRYAA